MARPGIRGSDCRAAREGTVVSGCAGGIQASSRTHVEVGASVWVVPPVGRVAGPDTADVGGVVRGDAEPGVGVAGRENVGSS